MAIDDKDLATAVSRELDDADTWMNSDLADQQASNLDYYNRQPFGNEQAGYSKVVTGDVMEVVEGIMPELMKLFTSGDSVVEFEPVDMEDVPAAEQATDYLNYIFLKRMNGFKILYDWFKDSLLMKNGFVRVGYTDEEEIEIIHFKDATKDEIDVLESEESVTDIEMEEVEDSEEGDKRWDIKVTRTKKTGCPYVETIPAEEFRIRERSKSIADSSFHAIVTDRTIGDMLECGYDEEDLETGMKSGNSTDGEQVTTARFSMPNEGTTDSDKRADGKKEDRLIEVVEAYIRTYDEELKRNVLLKVIMVGNKVLEQEEVSRSPIISLSPIMMPNKFTGIAVADLVRDLQEIRSMLYRQMLDNLALQNAGRYTAVESQVNLQDLLDNKIGGIVRTKSHDAVRRLDTPVLSNFTIPVLDKLDDLGERRVGVSKMSTGLDPNALTSHTGSQQLNQVMTAAQQKILLIARVFAETGVKDLFRYLYEEVRTHDTKSDIVKLRGKFVEVKPFDFIERKDMNVTVGIGNGNKDQQLMHLQGIGQMLQQIGSTEYASMIKPENVHHYATEFIKNSGYKNPEAFISDQYEPPQPEQPSASDMKDMAQAELYKAEAASEPEKVKVEQAKVQHAAAELEWKKKVESAETLLEADQKRAVGIGKS